MRLVPAPSYPGDASHWDQQLTSANVLLRGGGLAQIVYRMNAANKNSGTYPTTTANAIEVRIERIAQLFHTLDPFPFREKDLDSDVEEFIVGGRESSRPISRSGS